MGNISIVWPAGYSDTIRTCGYLLPELHIPEGWQVWQKRALLKRTKKTEEALSDDPYTSSESEEEEEAAAPEVPSTGKPLEYGGVALFIQVDAKKNPVLHSKTGTIWAVDILAHHANVWLEDGTIIETSIQTARYLFNGNVIEIVGSPIVVEGDVWRGHLVNCKVSCLTE